MPRAAGVRETLARIDGKIDQALDSIREDRESLKDHEKRLRDLEGKPSALTASVLWKSVASAVTILIALYGALHIQL